MALGKRGGFTLVELMIVIIVVGILAAVAIPMYQVMPQRSRGTEAATALGLGRSAMRVYYAELGTFENASFTDGARVTTGDLLGVSDFDLLGKYFSTECYTFNGAPTAAAYSIECLGSASTATYGSEVATIGRTIDHEGTITNL